MTHALSALAKMAGRKDLCATAHMLDEFLEPMKLLFGRLAALNVGEICEKQLFNSPTTRTQNWYAERAGRRGGSVVSQLSKWQREVLLTGRPIRDDQTRGLALFHGAFVSCFHATTPGRGLALFLWKPEVYDSPLHTKRAVTLKRPKGIDVGKLLRPFVSLLNGNHKSFGTVSSWGLLARTLPPRHSTPRGFLSPWGRGYDFDEEAPAERPCVSLDIAKMLTGFFHDEPLSLAYSRTHWLMFAPGRMFAVLPARRSGDLRNWLHFEQEEGRLKELHSRYTERQAGKKSYYARYERKRRMAEGRKNVRGSRRKSGTKTRRRKSSDDVELAAPNLQALYDLLSRLLPRRARRA